MNSISYLNFKNLSIQNTMSDRTPYTYLIGWSSLNMWYYGSKYGKGAHPDTFWKNYFTSSKLVKEFRKLCGEPDIIQIRRIFYDSVSPRDWERTCLLSLDVMHRKDFLNKSNAVMREYPVPKNLIVAFDKSTGTTAKIDSALFYMDQNLVGTNDGMVTVKDISGNTQMIRTTDYRLTSGEVVQHLTHMCYVFDNTNELLWISVEKYKKNKKKFRFVEFCKSNKTPHNAGKIPMIEIATNIIKLMTPESIEYSSGKFKHPQSNMVNGHDVHGNTYRIPKDDIRIVSGEIAPAACIMCFCVDSDGIEHWVRKSNPKIKDGTLTFVRFCPLSNPNRTNPNIEPGFVAKDKFGNTFRVTYDDIRICSGDIVGARSKMIFAFDESGEEHWVRKSDCRLNSTLTFSRNEVE